ncbi:MAG: NAD(P)/FAD-dependent oxidoreductase [Bacteroidaceae bacterium]|nr:NAD(P)/FAD-dependent oxidoreductase [Bacteroidaceae bacterium]
MIMTDLIIIGAGPGGYKAAVHAAKHGLKVVIFEDAHVGGTCLNVGCIPTKTYVHSATFAEAIERQPQVVEALRGGVETLLSHPNITLVRGRASFVDARTVCCDSVATNETYTAPNIIIATGSSPKMLPIAGVDNPRVVDSTGLLALKELPKKLCIIGAGVIGMEFASVFQRFGSEVTVIEYLKECLPMVDSDIAKRLRKLLEKRGITFYMGAGVKAVVPGVSSSGLSVLFDQKGKELSVDADAILMATGRKANTEGLNLEAAGIALAKGGIIPVDEHFKVLPIERELEGVFAIGDVNGRQMLAHAAEMQGIHVVNRILGIEDKIRFEVMPAAIFTEPEAACVGPTEDQLKEAGIPFECHKSFYRANGKALAMNETEGMVKLCCELDEGKLLSAHVFGAHAADIVQEVTAYITLGATLRQLRDTVHIHPTLSEVLIEVN